MAALDTMPMLYAFEDMESGGKENNIENDFAYRNNVANASQRIRMGKFNLVLKVFLHRIQFLILENINFTLVPQLICK